MRSCDHFLRQADQWTLRRCSAIAIDTIACTFAEDLMPILLPVLQKCFSVVGDSDAEWHVRECGILALGSVGEGCGEYLMEHFSVIMPFLVSQLRDTRVGCDVSPLVLRGFASDRFRE